MRSVTFLVLEGVDKGRVFRDLPVPVTIGREEGNVLRLNDERVSRYHAKIQTEDSDVILTDLDSTNGSRVNGSPVQIRRLRPGDQVMVGRTMLLFGTIEEIEARRQATGQTRSPTPPGGIQTIRANELAEAARSLTESPVPANRRNDERTLSPSAAAPGALDWSAKDEDIPPVPMKLTGAQTARLAEIFDYMHRGLTLAVENIQANEDGTEIVLGFSEWQTVQAVQMLLARYSRMVAEPEPHV